MASVFISYNSRDAGLAESISSALAKRKHKVLSDRSLLGASDDWRKKLAHALETSDAVVSLITENSVGAPYPMSEIGAARALRKKLIPVVIGAVPPPNVIQDIYYISESFSGKSKAAGMKRIVNKIDQQIKEISGKEVFIVHGTNNTPKKELKRMLAGLGLKPIVLHEQDDKGLAIIEKFELYAPNCRFAFVLLTPEDRQATGGKPNEKWRARQNVIMELGWFMAKLGRERIALLHQGEVEIPSDISGVIYLKFKKTVSEVSKQIRQRLQGVGLLGP